MRPSHALLLALSLAACERTPPPPDTSRPAASSPNPSPPSAPKPAGPDVLELLGGLHPGDKLGPVEVVSVGAPSRGRIPVEVSKGEARGLLEIALKGGDGPLPPASSNKYAFFFASPRPGPTPIDQASLTAACEALVTRLRASEDKVPVPAGVATYGAATKEL